MIKRKRQKYIGYARREEGLRWFGMKRLRFGIEGDADADGRAQDESSREFQSEVLVRYLIMHAKAC